MPGGDNGASPPILPCLCLFQYQSQGCWEGMWQLGCLPCLRNTGYRVLATGALLKSHPQLAQSHADRSRTRTHHTSLPHERPTFSSQWPQVLSSAPAIALFCMSCTSEPMDKDGSLVYASRADVSALKTTALPGQERGENTRPTSGKTVH